MSPRERVTGLEAARRVLAEAQREEFVAVSLVARALRTHRRRVLRDWTGRLKLPVTRVGRETMLAAALVVESYFPHRSPVSRSHSGPFGTA